MAKPRKAPPSGPAPRPRHPWRDTVEGLLSALVMVLIIRHFVFEVFKIPTGSMAPTLLGQHRDLQCPNCGLEFPLDAGDTSVGTPRVSPASCPNCGYEFPPREVLNTFCACFPSWPDWLISDRTKSYFIYNAPRSPLLRMISWTLFCGGDNRVIVDKFLCAFREPKRWDVIVFRSPIDDKTLIKRLVGLPGETIQIRHGDLYVNGKIAPRPPEVQQAMWRFVFDSAHVPKMPIPDFPPLWIAESGALSDKGGILRLTPGPGGTAEAQYGRPIKDDSIYSGMPGGHAVGELQWDVRVALDGPGVLRLKIVEDDVTYVGAVRFGTGAAKTSIGASAEGATPVESNFSADPAKPHRVVFSNAADRVELSVDDQMILSRERAMPWRREGVESRAALEVQSAVAVFTRVRLSRSNYYVRGEDKELNWFTGSDGYSVPEGAYFVLGDNTRNSADSRFWASSASKAPMKFLPRQALIGQALVTWWPPTILRAIR